MASFLKNQFPPPALGNWKELDKIKTRCKKLSHCKKMRNGVHENYLVICFCFLFVNKKMTVCLFSFFSNFLDLRTEKRSQPPTKKKGAR